MFFMVTLIKGINLNVDLSSMKKEVLDYVNEIMEEANHYKSKGITFEEFSDNLKRKWEEEVHNRLISIVGKHAFLGKDCGFKGDPNSDVFIICDSFDGSGNFLTDLKYYSFNLALACKGRLVYGICVDLSSNDVYEAKENGGAFLNGKSIKPPLAKDRKGRIICSNIPLGNFSYIHLKCSSLELCLLARKSVDAVVGKSENIDIAAAYLVALESGVEFLDKGGKRLEFPIKERKRLSYIAYWRDGNIGLQQLISMMSLNV